MYITAVNAIGVCIIIIPNNIKLQLITQHNKKEILRYRTTLKLFCVELLKVVEPSHEMVKNANSIDWDRMGILFGETNCPANYCPGINARLIASLYYLKYISKIIDDIKVAGWVENTYWQHICGVMHFYHKTRFFN